MEDIKNLDELWEKLPELAARAGYEAGLEHLAAGYPIYYPRATTRVKLSNIILMVTER